MPDLLKNRVVSTDAPAMTDTAVTTTETAPPATPDGMFLDGEAPRLGSAPIIPPAPMGSTGTQVASDGAGAAPLPVVSPVLAEERFAKQKPPVDDADLPTLPTVETTRPLSTEDDVDDEPEDDDGEPRHPMAHLMPAKSKPTEASIRAAEKRAVKKAKAKKIKIGVAVAALAVAALSGPPLVSWLSDAVDDAGGLNEEPAD